LVVFSQANTPANGTDDVSGLETLRPMLWVLGITYHVCSVTAWTVRRELNPAKLQTCLPPTRVRLESFWSKLQRIEVPPPPFVVVARGSSKTLFGMVFFHHLRSSISHSFANVLGRAAGMPPRAPLQPSPLLQQRPFFWFGAFDNFLLRPQQQQQVRAMSKYLSKSAKKRIPLNTKRVAKGFYKGKGCTKEGRITKKAKFMVDKTKQLELVVPPDLANFRLKPYISADASRFPPERRHTPVS
jgi:hypothetical protein